MHFLAKVLEQLLNGVVVVVMVVVLAVLPMALLVGRVRLRLLLVDAETLGEGGVVETVAVEGSAACAAVGAVHRLKRGVPTHTVVIQRGVGGTHAVEYRDRRGTFAAALLLSAGTGVREILMIRLGLIDVV